MSCNNQHFQEPFFVSTHFHLEMSSKKQHELNQEASFPTAPPLDQPNQEQTMTQEQVTKPQPEATHASLSIPAPPHEQHARRMRMK
jgi:hypothetical protein